MVRESLGEEALRQWAESRGYEITVEQKEEEKVHQIGDIVEDPLYHVTELHHGDLDEKSWITFAKKANTKSGWFQRGFPRDKIKDAVSSSEWKGKDIYFTMNSFYRPFRKAENIRQLRALYQDFDFYKHDDWKHLSPEQMLRVLEDEVFEILVPQPNYIIFSGQGLQAIWLLKPGPATKKPLRLWKRIQQYFYEETKEYGSDPATKDESRVFRVAGSINSKNGEKVRIMKLKKERYELSEIQELWLPQLVKPEPKDKPTTKPPKKKAQDNHSDKPSKKSSSNKFSFYDLAKYRANDLEQLVFMRKRDTEGMRVFLLWVLRYQLAYSMLRSRKKKGFSVDYIAKQTLNRVLEVNNQFLSPLPEEEVTATTEPAITMIKRIVNQEEPSFNSKTGKAFKHVGYAFTNEWLIEVFQITPEEQKNLRTIISAEEKKRRRTQKARENGVVEREEYIQAMHKKTEQQLEKLQALLLENPRIKGKEIAHIMGITPARVSQLKKELKN